MAEATHLPLRAGFNRVPTARAGHFILFLTGAGTAPVLFFFLFCLTQHFVKEPRSRPKKGWFSKVFVILPLSLLLFIAY